MKKRMLRQIRKAPVLPLGKGNFYVALFDVHFAGKDKLDKAKGGTLGVSLPYYLQRMAQFIFGGDWWDLWMKNGEKIYFAWKRMIDIMVRALVFVCLGNHDAKLWKYLKVLGVPKDKVGEFLWIGRKILLFHGNQYDFWNNGGTLTMVVKWFVRYIWSFLQKVVLKSKPEFSAASIKNNDLSDSIRDQAIELAKKEDCIVIIGHRHRPEMIMLGGHAVFIDGGCYGDYAVEIMPEKIELVKWDRETGNRKVLRTYWMPAEGETSVELGHIAVGV